MDLYCYKIFFFILLKTRFSYSSFNLLINFNEVYPSDKDFDKISGECTYVSKSRLNLKNIIISFYFDKKCLVNKKSCNK